MRRSLNLSPMGVPARGRCSTKRVSVPGIWKRILWELLINRKADHVTVERQRSVEVVHPKRDVVDSAHL